MKKLLSIIVLSTSLTIIASCGKSEQTTLPTETPTPTESPIETEELLSAVCEGMCEDEDTKCTYSYDSISSTAKFYITINGTHKLYEDVMDGKKTKEEWNESVNTFNSTTKVLYDFFVSEGYYINVEVTFFDDVNNTPIFISNNGETTYDIISLIKDNTGWNTPTPEPTVEPTEKPDTTVTLLKKNGITIKTDADRLKYHSDINLEVKNNSGKDIIMRITDLSIEDEMADCYYRQIVKNGKKSTESLKIYNSNFYEGSKIEFTVEVMNKNYHMLFTKTVKFTVPKDEEE